MGPDDMHPRTLKELADKMENGLATICENIRENSGEVTGDWKKGNITPILKEGRKEDPGN